MAGHGQRQPSADCFIGVRPTVFPEGQLRDVHVVDTETTVLAQRDPGGIEMGSGVVEVAEADLNVGPDHQEHVGEVRRDAAHRSRARPFCFLPIASGGQCLDVVGRQNGAVDRVRPDRVQSRLPKSRGLARAAEHRENVGQRDIGRQDRPRFPAVLGKQQGLTQVRQALVGLAQVGEVRANRLECSGRGARRINLASLGQRGLRDLERLREAPGCASARCQGPPTPARVRPRPGLRGTSATARSSSASPAAVLPLSCKYWARLLCIRGNSSELSSVSSMARSVSSTARGAAPVWLAEAAAQEHRVARSSPATSPAPSTSSHSERARSRWPAASLSPKTPSASAAAATDVANASALRPAAAQ